MAMSFVPQMQNYFGKDTDFTKLSNAYGDSNALGVQSDIQGDLIRDQAKKRAEMRLMAGEHALSQGQAAGSHAAWGGVIDGIGSAAGGFLQSDMAKNMFGGGNSYGGFGSTGGPGNTVKAFETSKYGDRFIPPHLDPSMQKYAGQYNLGG